MHQREDDTRRISEHRLTAILDDYSTWLRSWNAAERTVGARRTFLRARLRAWGTAGFTTTNIQTFLARPDRTDWTKATYHAHFKSFCEWALPAGVLDHDPMNGVRKPIVGREQPRPLTDRDVERVLNLVSGDTRTWVLLALRAGLRVSEIAKIRGVDVSEQGVWVKGKGSKGVTLPCHPDLWALAQTYDPTDYWFPSADGGHIPSARISRVVGVLFDALGLDGSIHRLRHTYCTTLLRNGVSVRQTQKLMRHASLATTAGYAAVDEDELRQAILRLPELPPTA